MQKLSYVTFVVKVLFIDKVYSMINFRQENSLVEGHSYIGSLLLRCYLLIKSILLELSGFIVEGHLSQN